MPTYQNTSVPKSLQNQTTSTSKYKVSGEELYILSSSLAVTQNTTTISEGNDQSAFYNAHGGFDAAIYAIAVQDDNKIKEIIKNDRISCCILRDCRCGAE